MHFGLWLVFVVIATAGGWFFGRKLADTGAPTATTQAVHPRSGESVFAAGSPQGLWIAKVKDAAPTDFPRLLEEMLTLFPESDMYEEGRRERALRWLFAMWLVKDTEGFLKQANGADFEYSYWAAQSLARAMPDKAAELLKSQDRASLDKYFLDSLAEGLAERHPELYLQINPDGTFEATPSHSSGYDDWEKAITQLAKTDPHAAANACLRWHGVNASSTLSKALLAVAREWKTDAPSFAEWVAGIPDPSLRNLAQHARLSALAEKDPQAALSELYSANLEGTESIDAPRDILKHLAQADPIAALELLKRVEAAFSQSNIDPYSDNTDLPVNEASPFQGLSPGRYAGENNLENNGVRHEILRATSANLPTDPTEFFNALHKMRTEMNGSGAWQRGVESELIRLKSANWSCDECLQVANMWATETNGSLDDATFRELAKRAVQAHPERALSALDQLPESARASFAAELTKHFSATSSDQSIVLIRHLTPSQWDENLGKSLGENPGDYAPVIASLPAETTMGARQAFMKTWGELDPEAAAQWLISIPDDAATISSAEGLTAAWASYDQAAASSWAASLPAGHTRDGAAAGIADSFARREPEEAWHWASAVSDPKTRAEAFYAIAYHWRARAPEKFRSDYAAARRAVGLPLLQHGTDIFK